MDPKSLKSLFSDAQSSLGELADRAATMVALRDIIAADLPDDHAAHVTDVALNGDNTLVVICDSPAWTARIRFDADLMLESARKAGFFAARCKVQTRPASA